MKTRRRWTRRLTLTGFYKRLSYLVRHGWQALDDEGGYIRLKPPGGKRFCHCPVTALCASKTGTGRSFRVYDWASAAKVLGLPRQNARTIVWAADCNSRFSLNVRQTLKKALKIS